MVAVQQLITVFVVLGIVAPARAGTPT